MLTGFTLVSWLEPRDGFKIEKEITGHGSCGFSEEGCVDVPWALENGSWNACHPRRLISSEEI